MLRGQNTLFTNIFPSSIAPENNRQGRRNALIDKRDEALADRYYYYVHLKRSRYDDALLSLEQEFFITADTIGTRLTPYVDYLKQLTSTNVKVSMLRRKYPHLNWAA